MNFAINNTTRFKLPPINWRYFKNEILGKNYDLSVAVVGDKKMQELNKKYRGKNKTTDVLSFGLDKNSGEIILNYSYIKKKAPEFKRNARGHLKASYIHGLLHLKGFGHKKISDFEKMQKQEKKWLKD